MLLLKSGVSTKLATCLFIISYKILVETSLDTDYDSVVFYKWHIVAKDSFKKGGREEGKEGENEHEKKREEGRKGGRKNLKFEFPLSLEIEAGKWMKP